MAILLFTVLLVLVAVLLLGVRVFFTRGGRFPNTHIHGNAALRDRGITCVLNSERTIHNNEQKQPNEL